MTLQTPPGQLGPPTLDFFDWRGGLSATIRKFAHSGSDTTDADDLATPLNLPNGEVYGRSMVFKSNENREGGIEPFWKPVGSGNDSPACPALESSGRQTKNQYELIANDRCMATVQLDAFHGLVKTLTRCR